MKPQSCLLTLAIAFAASNCGHRPGAIYNANLASAQQSPPSTKQSLPCAVTDADFSKTRALLESGASVDSTADDCISMEPSPRGVTLLMRAAYLAKLETIGLLLDHGANPNAHDSYEDTPIVYAISGKNIDAIAALLNKNANVNAKAELNRTPLMTAAAEGDIGIINYLIDHGAQINISDAHGSTALMFAAGLKQAKAKFALLSRGANPKMKDHRGRTYLNYAKHGFPDEYLILRR